MMSTGDWKWMMGGAWQNMTRQDWQRLHQRLLGSTPSRSHDGTSGWMIAAITLGVALLAVTIGLLIGRRRPFRGPPTAEAPS
jgi:hypothetical protein